MPSDGTAGGAFTGRRDLLKLAAFLGVGLMTPVARAAMAASEPWSPGARALIADIAETVIPATDTGGAKAAGVPAFIEMMVADWFDPAERAHFLEGMAAFDAGAQAAYGKPFAELAQAAKDEYYGKQLAVAAPTPPGGARPRTPFAALMKRLTVYGYYTSELGGSVELRLDMVPNEYLPDAPFKPGDRADSFILYSLSPFSAT
ncbi:MAG: gluconate 2-dehydrogenase subunit 3 family protein [Sphingopyxis sp.]|nr:gluconate 2-dehydrogenase subunit 3 family protein [Sphingopyxis sp.]